jgi:tellurite resistance protein TehA-like permease
MRAYVMTTGVVFGLLVAAHVWRALVEGPHLLADPLWMLITAVAAAFCAWAFRVLWRSRGRPGSGPAA